MTRARLIQVTCLCAVLAAGAYLIANETGPFTVNDKAHYASASAVNFVRPGLVITIMSAQIAADGTITTRVKFSDPQGLPLDRLGITTPGAISGGNPGMIAAVFSAENNEFRAYTTRTQTSPITRNSAIQAATDTGGTWQQAAEGEYTYTFGVKAPAGHDRSAVHAIGVYGNRVLTEFEMGTQLDDEVYYFVPATGQTASNPHDQIRTATCQKCHGPNMHFHGETGRSSVRMCELCHTSQTSDPDTGNTVDLKVMVHKIHMGANLPSVRAGRNYRIIGFGQTVADYSTVEFPAPMMKCEVCHEQNRGAAQPNVHLTRPSRAACGSCHDDVNFTTGERHADLPQISDNQCATCHWSVGDMDFDVSIAGAHVVPQESSLLTGLQWGIQKVENATAGSRPTVTFTVKDKNGNPLALSDLNRVAVTLAGPTTDYAAFGRGYVQEDASRAQGANGVYAYTFNQAIPAAARGTYAVGVEGRRVEVALPGTTRQRSIQYGATNPVTYFSVDGSPLAPRREPTPSQNCLQCHYRLALHGENRINNVQYCAFCHNPVETDAARRPAAANPPETVALKFLAHRVHGGERLHEEFGVNYTVYGFGGNPIAFNEVRFPAPLNECFVCHTNGSENPSTRMLSQSPVTAPRYPVNPLPPITAACYGCHADNAMLSHARANTTDLGESCSVCHASASEFAATRMHAGEVTVNRDQAGK